MERDSRMCPRCDSIRTVDLVFGLTLPPTEDNDFEPGGCLLPPYGPEDGWRHCRTCGYEYHPNGMSLADAYGGKNHTDSSL